MLPLATALKGLIPKSQFARSVVLVAGGTAISQGITIVSSPILTRTYSPEAFGVLSMFSSILSVLMVLATLRYEMAVPLPEEDSDAINVLSIAVGLVLMTSLVTTAVGWLMGDVIFGKWQWSSAHRGLLWLLPIGMVGSSTYAALTSWATRRRNFVTISQTRAVQALGQASVQGVCGLAGLGASGLVFGYVISQFLGIMSLYKKAGLPISEISWSRIKANAVQYREFPMYTMWAALISTVGLNAPPVLFTYYFGLETSGLFALTMRILALPAALIGQAVGQVFYPVAARHVNDSKRLVQLIEKVTTTLWTISVILFPFLALQGPLLFRVAFGAAWGSSGSYARLLAPWFLTSFVSSPLSTFVFVSGKQKQGLFITLYETGLRLTSIWVGARFKIPELAVGLFGLAGASICVIYLAWVLKLAGTSLMSCLRQVRLVTVFSIGLTSVAAMANRLLPEFVALAISVFLFVGLFLWSLSTFSSLEGTDLV